MILYNVTVSIDPQIELDWINWMKTVHIPDVMNTKCFFESRLSRVHGEEEGGVTYAISYVAESQDKIDEYQDKFAPKLQMEHTVRYNGKFAAFRTMLTILEEFKV